MHDNSVKQAKSWVRRAWHRGMVLCWAIGWSWGWMQNILQHAHRNSQELPTSQSWHHREAGKQQPAQELEPSRLGTLQCSTGSKVPCIWSARCNQEGPTEFRKSHVQHRSTTDMNDVTGIAEKGILYHGISYSTVRASLYCSFREKNSNDVS